VFDGLFYMNIPYIEMYDKSVILLNTPDICHTFVSHAIFLLCQWPFTRFLGIQEPASVVFSIFNFIAHYLMIKQFRREVRRSSPMYWLWHAYALVSVRFPLASFVWLPDQNYIFNIL